MFKFFSGSKQKKQQEKFDDINKVLDDLVVSSSLESNISALKKLFDNNDTFIIRKIKCSAADDLEYFIAYNDGLVDSSIINENIVKPLMLYEPDRSSGSLITPLIESIIQINEVKTASDMNTLIRDVTYGDTLLFVDGEREAAILNTKSFIVRSPDEPEGEKILSGPRDGFTEGLMSNLSLVRRRIRTNDLKMKFHTMGRRTSTTVCVSYIDSLVNKDVLSEIYKRLSKIDIDGILDSNYIVELIKDKPYSLFKSMGFTERPDVIVAKLLEGRVAIFVDGSPIVITAPYLFIENFQSNEDYYLNYAYASFSRLLRIMGFSLSIFTPGIYVAMVAYHHEMIPTQLMISIAMERSSVPFPAALEAFLMLLVFDILRETGIRMPANIGHALSIVGALVIGQAAVDAKFVAAPMIIVVGFTGITGLLVPKMNGPVVYLRYILLTSAALLGFFGLLFTGVIILVYVLNLSSFGVSQYSISVGLNPQDMKDKAIRVPWHLMFKRPSSLTDNKVRMREKKDDDNA